MGENESLNGVCQEPFTSKSLILLTLSPNDHFFFALFAVNFLAAKGIL